MVPTIIVLERPIIIVQGGPEKPSPRFIQKVKTVFANTTKVLSIKLEPNFEELIKFLE